MGERAVRAVAVILLVAGVLAAAVVPAAAVDAPKWVAALYVEAQKSVGLRWSMVPGATGFKVLRSTTKGSGWAEIASTTAPQYFDAGVEPGTTYYYVLQAVAGAETSPASDERSVAIAGVKKVVVPAPEWEAAAAQSTTEFGKTTHRVALVWKKVPVAVAYNIYRSEVAGKDYGLVGSQSEERYADTQVVEGKSYYYVVSALDGSFQESPMSAERAVEVKKVEAEKKVAKKKAEKLDLVPKRSKVVLDLPAEGQPPLNSIFDIAFHREEQQAYIVDGQAGKIFIYDEAGELVKEFGETGYSQGMFVSPTGITVSPEGNLVVADIGRHVVMLFGPEGKFLREFRNDKKIVETDQVPTIVSALQLPSGEFVMVDNANNRIVVCSEDGKEIVRSFGKRAEGKDTGPGTMSTPGKINYTGEGSRVLLRDYGMDRAQVLDAEKGEGVMILGEGVKGLIGAFVKVGTPISYRPAKDVNEIIVPDNAMGNIQGFNAETGAYLYTIVGEDGKLVNKERPDWQITSTNFIDYDSKGRLWVAETLPRRIKVLEFLK